MTDEAKAKADAEAKAKLDADKAKADIEARRAKRDEDEDEVCGFERGAYHFEVASEQAPGIYRQGIGLIQVGEVFDWPDKATPGKLIDGCEFPEILSAKLVPLDVESRDLLKAMHGARGDIIAAIAAKKRKEGGVTVKPVKVVVDTEPKRPKKRGESAGRVSDSK